MYLASFSQQTYLPCFYRTNDDIVKAAQSCLTLCNPMDCSLPGSSVHEILQARILDWGSSPRDLLNPGIKPGCPGLQADSLPAELPGKPEISEHFKIILSDPKTHVLSTLLTYLVSFLTIYEVFTMNHMFCYMVYKNHLIPTSYNPCKDDTIITLILKIRKQRHRNQISLPSS